MKFFNFIAEKISYTFAVALITVAVGWVLGVFGFILGSAFIIVSYDRIVTYIAVWIPIFIFIPSFLHYLHFGLLTPIGIPAFFQSHRRLNRSFKEGLKETENLEPVYRDFSDFPMYNMLASVFYAALVGLLIIGFAFFEYKFRGNYSFIEFMIVVKIATLGVIIVMILYGMSSYLITEALTNRERALIYNEILRRGKKIRPHALIGIRLKFMFFVWLMILTLLAFTALMEKGRFYNQDNVTLIVVYFIVSVLASFFLMQITTRSIFSILNDLRRVTREIASGGRAAFQVLSLEKEFASIEYALMEMAWEIDEYRVDLQSKVDLRTSELQDALENLKGRDDLIQKQLDMASVIQRSILPGKIPDWNELKFSVRYIAMEKIGGDFYDVIPLKDDRLGIIMADVSGHGIPAALVTTMAKMSFGNAGSRYDSPRKIFQEVNQNILDHVKTQDYMTCFMVTFDDDYNIVYSNASHQKAILMRGETGSIELLDTGGLFIGALEDARDTYEEKSDSLRYGDRIILYTDGIPESINEERDEYSNKRLETLIVENRHLPLEEFSDLILSDLRNFMGNASVMDDITFLVIELARDEVVETIKNAMRLINTHKYYDAIDLLEKGRAKFPDNQKLLYNLAKNYFRLNNYNKTIENIVSYIENDDKNKNAFYICGVAYYKMYDYKNAVENFERALSLDSSFIKVIFALGMALKKMGELEKARTAFERVVSIDPDNKMALFEVRGLDEPKGE